MQTLEQAIANLAKPVAELEVSGMYRNPADGIFNMEGERVIVVGGKKYWTNRQHFGMRDLERVKQIGHDPNFKVSALATLNKEFDKVEVLELNLDNAPVIEGMLVNRAFVVKCGDGEIDYEQPYICIAGVGKFTLWEPATDVREERWEVIHASESTRKWIREKEGCDSINLENLKLLVEEFVA